MNKRTLIICLIILNLISIISLYSSLHQEGRLKDGNILYKQILWLVIFWIVIIAVSFINYRIYYDAGIYIYIINILLLIGVILFGQEKMGAQRWFSVFGLNFQPSEFSKLAVVILLARCFSFAAIREKHIFLRKVILPFSLVAINSLLIFKQPDLGTAGILIIVFFMIGLSSRINKRYFIGIIIAGMIISPFGWELLKDYQKKRLTVFLTPDVDPLGAGYTIIQSKIAIASGRIFGKGFLAGTQNQFNFLPERHTDFIFTVLAEEFGFIGCLFLLFIYSLILRIIINKMAHIKDNFAQLICIGIYSTIFLHIFINIGMTMGLVPVVGLPLLFLSYGGTHLIITAIFIGVFLNISKQC
ncbi:MAG: rod shape-determining protein RodA [Candidatus Omnitrophota bacterium]